MAETRLKVTYSVTSTTYSTQLFKTSYFSKAELADGTELPSNIFDVGNHAYVFSATGNNDVFYTMTGNTIGGEAFEGMTRIVAVDIPSTVTTLGGRCFRNCTNLSSVTLADTVSSFGEGAFDADVALESIVIPSTAVTMNSKVFRGCTSLTSITMSDTTAPAVSADTFYQVQTGGTLYYPTGSTYSNWLSNNEYYLGYYNWNGVETGGTPTGQTDITDIFAGYAEYYSMPAVDSPFSAGKFLILFYYSPTDAQIDLQVTSSNNNLFFNPHYDYSGISSDYSRYAYKAYLVDVSKTVTGSSVITAVDRNTGLQTSRKVYKVLSAETPNLYVNPSAYTFNSGASFNYTGLGIAIADIIEDGCMIDSSTTGDRNGHVGWAISDGNKENWDQPIFDAVLSPNSQTKKLQATKIVPNTGDTRWFIGDTVFNDTSGNSYLTSFKIIQEAGSGYTPTPPDRWMYLNPSGKTHAASAQARAYFYIRSSGCSIDSSYTPTFTFSGDTSFIDSIYRVSYASQRFTVTYNYSHNLSDSDREVYITVNGVHDTDGNVYNDLVFHATQGWSAYTFLNYDSDDDISSGGGVDTIEVVGVNTNICSVDITYSGTNRPQYWEGVEQPTITVLGNYITVNWPANPFNDRRDLGYTISVTWGENCEKTTALSYVKRQDAAATPVQKDIKAADTDYSVGSGTGNASTTFQTSGCTYDHFTYITGGSFSVTATSGSDNTIVFTYPENPTTSPRTGYIYITFYDSDGNTYGPQTITFTQQAGSSPGPGPGPDPETGYVLTTLTISDQEQHRYFVEARPGVVYSAAGQYYKTVLACEARYSLYYVNSYGGVDVLPFKEKSWKKSDTVTRFNYSRSFRNNTLEFENVNYMNEIKASWELHTGWMSDESSQRMHELVESTIVYLYDAEEKTYTPVVMTDKKLEYKTYYNQGKKFYNYTVNVEESQSKERR